MPFIGNDVYSCHMDLFKHKEIFVVIVSGAQVNLCGHALINFGGYKGHYVHVDGLRTTPKYMNHFDYARYLEENEKTELYRTRINVPNPKASLLKLEELLSKRWFWGVVIHNCSSFVEEVANAGGANFHIKSNCPTNFIPVRAYD